MLMAFQERDDRSYPEAEIQAAAYNQFAMLSRLGACEESIRAQVEGMKDFSYVRSKLLAFLDLIRDVREKLLSRFDDLNAAVTKPVKPRRYPRKNPAPTPEGHDADGDDVMEGHGDAIPLAPNKELKDPGLRSLELIHQIILF